jgi:hypothetical protein
MRAGAASRVPTVYGGKGVGHTLARATLRRGRRCLDFGCEAFEQSRAAPDAFAFQPLRYGAQGCKFLGYGFPEDIAQALRQPPPFRPFALDLFKLRENFCDCVAHPLSCAPADAEFCGDVL